MRGLWPSSLLVLVVGAGLMPPARAENPVVSLKLEKVTAAEAVTALSNAAGVSVQLAGGAFMPPAEGLPGERASFDWTKKSFGAALRELCGQFHLRPQRRGSSTYTLYPFAQAPARKGDGPSSLQRGMRMSVNRINISNNRSIDFKGGNGAAGGESMRLDLGALFHEGDPELVAGISNVSARDDLGNLLTQPDGARRLPSSLFMFSSDFPDEWSGTVTLPPPSIKARKLLWLEGELLLYREIRRRRVETTLPLPEGGAKVSFEGGTLDVRELRTTPGRARANLPASPGTGYTVSAVLTLENQPTTGNSGDRTLHLVGASGRVYDANSTSSQGQGMDGAYRFVLSYGFASVPEPVKGLFLRLTEKVEGDRTLPFRITNIPLPAEAPALIPRVATRLEGALPGGIKPPYFQSGGGVLKSRILIAGKPAPAGQLSVGLAEKTADGWGATRWVTLPVKEMGEALYSDLKPGTYRLLREYRPLEELTNTTTGRWEGEELEVTLAAGKEATLPPLQWVATPQKLPAKSPAGKPAKPAATSNRKGQ